MPLNNFFNQHELGKVLNVSFAEFLGRYKKINHLLWQKMGKKKISKDELRWQRFYKTLLFFQVDDLKLSKSLSLDYLKISPFQTALFPNTKETLEALKKEGYPMHIITNGFVEVQHIKLKESGLHHYFDVVLCSEETGTTKPDPVVFKAALKKANCKAENSVMIGDDYMVDCVGAQNAGMKSIFFNFRQEKRERKGENNVQDLSELTSMDTVGNEIKG